MGRQKLSKTNVADTHDADEYDIFPSISDLDLKPKTRSRSNTPSILAKGIAANDSYKDDQEPSAKEIAQEESVIKKAAPKKPSTARASIAAQDPLAAYMEQLSHIPLFSPTEEREEAQRLEALEIFVWREILLTPRAVQILHMQLDTQQEAVESSVQKLLKSYQRSAARTQKDKLPLPPTREALVEELSILLRQEDFDKSLLNNLMQRIRREVWSRRVLGMSPSFRISHNRLTDLERAGGVALRARNDFVRANLRLVVSVARRYHHSRVPFIDLIQEGNVGLMKGVHRFDHSKGFRFSTYAHWWIRQAIERAIINKGSQVRLPVHIIDSRRQVNRALAKLTQDLGRRPSTKEISAEIEIPVKKVEEIMAGVQQDPISLDDTVSNNDNRKLLDMMNDPSELRMDEALIRENTHAQVREMLSLLNPIERDIIRRRFGLGNDLDQTLEEIGEAYNLSRERIRQIQAQGLQKMRRLCDRRQVG